MIRSGKDEKVSSVIDHSNAHRAAGFLGCSQGGLKNLHRTLPREF
jgi:hypothetical protein